MNLMKLKVTFVMIIVQAFLFMHVHLMAQQTATISGQVIDSSTGDPMIGVNVIIKELGKVAVTNIDGKYILKEVPAGKYKLEFRMMGYKTATTEVEVVPGKESRVNITMRHHTVQEVVVVARKVSNTEASLLKIRQKAPVAQDAISSEQISKTPDRDAGDAAKRVTGVTIVDGKSGKVVFVRGLGERYSSVVFAGTTLPSPDPDKRIIPLDIFPAGLLDNLIIVKSYLPQMSGEFGGGVVQINPKDYPEKHTLKVTIGTGFHPNTTGKDFLTYDGGKYDFFGYDDSTRALPNGLRDDYLSPINYSPAEIEQIGKNLKNEYTPDTTKAIIPFNSSFVYGDTYKMGTGTFGLIVSGLFSSNSKNTDIKSYRFTNDWIVHKDYDVQKSTYSTSKGLLLSTAYSETFHKWRFTTFYSHQSEDSTSLYFGYNFDRQEPTLPGAISTEKRYRLHFMETGLFFNQLEGEHYIQDFFDSTFNWSGSVAKALRREPDVRDVQLIDQNSTGVFHLYRTDDLKRRFMDHVEWVYDFSPNITFPFRQWSGLASKFKIGSAFTYKKRESENRIFIWENTGLNSPANQGEPLENVFNPNNIVGISTSNTKYNLREVSMQNDYYIGKLAVIAGYGQIDMPLFPKFRMVGGLRYEFSDMDFLTYNPVTTKYQDLKKEPLAKNNFMPGVSFTYAVTDTTNVRVAYSKTLIRPDFLDVSEYKRETMIASEVIIGNPELKQCNIHNYDLRAEWFPSDNEIIAASLFYKHLVNPIEMLEIQGTAGSATYQVANAKEARNMGIELEAKKGLGMIHKTLQNFALYANFAYIYSRIKVEDKPYADYTSNDRPLQGQSPYVVNLGLYYDNEKLGFNSTVLYNVYGRRIVRVGTVTANTKNEDIYEEPVGRLDLVIKQDVSKNGQLKFTASNLLDPKIKETQVREHAVTKEKKKFVLETYRAGRNFSISYTHSF